MRTAADNNPLSDNRRINGFTLLELVVTAALIALLTSATWVTYTRTWKQWVLRQNAQQLYLAARYARVLAIEGRKPCQLVIDQQKSAIYILQESDESEGETLVSNVWHRSVLLADSVRIERITTLDANSVGAPKGEITFHPDGSADAVSVQVGNGIRCYTIQIQAATGRAKLLDGAIITYEPERIDLDQAL
jgi:prepilin-type N-terminal cleavage/methylation domain-containing protein